MFLENAEFESPQFLGPFGNQPGSAGILLWFRQALHQRILQERVHSMYDWMGYTRSDYYYACNHPNVMAMSTDDNNSIWIVSGEDYGGITDRHLIARTPLFMQSINILHNMFTNATEYERELLSCCSHSHGGPNLEKVIQVHLELSGFENKVKRFNRVMYAVANANTTTRWAKAQWNAHAHQYIKYNDEYEAAMQNCNPQQQLTRIVPFCPWCQLL